MFLKVGIKGQPLIIDGDFPAAVKIEDSVWTLEDKKSLVLTIEKVDKKEWWSQLLTSQEAPLTCSQTVILFLCCHCQ